jgi:hypothetical protein
MDNEGAIKLTACVEEAAYHEAGHAAIELLNNFTPQLILLRAEDTNWSGECYSCSPTTPDHSHWLAEKAIAGVLCQAKYVAQKHCQAKVRIEEKALGDHVIDFLLSLPRHSLEAVS